MVLDTDFNNQVTQLFNTYLVRTGDVVDSGPGAGEGIDRAASLGKLI